MANYRERLAFALSLLMITLPFASAGVSNWTGPTVVRSQGEPVVVDGFSVPANSTVMDGWLHVTNSPLTSSSDPGIVWDQDDFLSGELFGLEISNNGELVLEDDGSRSNISTFDVGEIEASLNSAFKFFPGWRRVFSQGESTSLSGCGGSPGAFVKHGVDHDFDQILDNDEIEEELVFCETFANGDIVTSLNITDPGDDYSPGNLSASGGGGSGFSGTYEISSGIESITILNGGSGYSRFDAVAIQAPHSGGSGAQASIGTVNATGSIQSIVIDNPGTGYQATDIINVAVANGSGASLSANVYQTGVIHSATVSDGGSNYTSAPSIVISDSNGSDGFIEAILGANYSYTVVMSSVPYGSDCPNSGFKIEAGLDLDVDRNLDQSEINQTIYICHQEKLWQATTFSELNGTFSGNEQTLAHGIVPSSPSEGGASAGTMPGQPVPAGTSGYLLLPPTNLPESEYISTFYMSFDHWYHVDSTASGGGDGTWVEYRTKSDNHWNNWTYIAPEGGYPSTLSTDAPVPNGATAPVPVFAAPGHSGWVSSNFTLSEIPDIAGSDEIQFRMQIWTHPNATTERPGWFVDNIDIVNDGVDLGIWHHGCYNPSATSCNYSPNAYAALERNLNLTGTNSTSKIELKMEWDLQGEAYDNACIEISLNGNTWADISSATSSTSTDCSSRTSPIPGNGYAADDGVTYTDQSNDLRSVSFDIPPGYYGEPSVDFRIVVDTNAWTNYGGFFPPDNREGLTVSHIRVADFDGNTLFLDNFSTANSMSHYGMNDSSGNPGTDDWIYSSLEKGVLNVDFGFEDSVANPPTVSNSPGWTTTTANTCSSDTCKFTLNRVTQNSGPPGVSTFPYAYGIGFSGNYDDDIDEARLISPNYLISTNGTTYFTFDHWACSEPGYDGGAVFIRVNNGSWQFFNPGGWYTGTASTWVSHNLAGLQIFTDVHCSAGTSNSGMTNLEANLDAYKGDYVRFKFAFGSDSSVEYSGWFIDNAGVKIANYATPGYWMSPTLSMINHDEFNLGFVDVEGQVHEDGWLTATVLDAISEDPIPGFTNVSFPFSLAGIDSGHYPEVKIRVDLGSNNQERTPILEKIHIGGKRVLNADSGHNGWDLSNGIEVIEGVLNATAVTGTITSDFVYSSRPIKSVRITGNLSSGILTSIYDVRGNLLGIAQKGVTIQFPTQQIGYSVSVNLPPSEWIDVLAITPTFSDPAVNPRIDFLDDGTEDWQFPLSDHSSEYGFGHVGWQSFLTIDGSYSRSSMFALDGSNPESLTVMLPETASVNTGIVAVSPDADGFDSPVTISIASSTISGGSGTSPFVTSMSQAQISGMGLLNPSYSDSSTGRQWIEIPLEISSSSPQTVYLSSIGIGYQFFENASGLGAGIVDYMASLPEDGSAEVDLPVSVTCDHGSLSIGGSIVYDYLFVNREFSVPNTLFPDREIVEIVTSHRHLFDNSQIEEITLTGTYSEGKSVGFRVQNSPDGLWGAGTSPVTFSQISGDDLAPLEIGSSYVIEQLHSDGYTDIEAHWMFMVDWAWDDVGVISWEARANDANGETLWPAFAQSGSAGMNAVENDLQIDSFEVRDGNGRLISNTLDTLFYPFPILEGSELNVSGTVRFQNTLDKRPSAGDYSVSLDLSGTTYQLQSGEGGSFFGSISSQTGVSEISLSPLMTRVGPGDLTNGAQDTTGILPVVEVNIDSNPPVAGPIQVQTPIGLQPIDGMVVTPTTSFSPFITISEGEARGEYITLNYWREGIDDTNGDGIADEEEYKSKYNQLSQGLTGEEQIQFFGIDISTMYNEQIHIYIEGSDWAGLTYQDGGTGGGPGAENSWASAVVAEDVMVEFAGVGLGTGSSVGSTFSLDRITKDSLDYFLLPGMDHTFKVRLDEPNGFRTIDNITIHLCGYGSEEGVIWYDPYNDILSSSESSMVSPLGTNKEQITSSITELSVNFRISWDWEFDDDSLPCKPRVIVRDGLSEIESEVLSALSWSLDNRLEAVPEFIQDLTPPTVLAQGTSLYLGQGDTFSVTGAVYHQGSGLKFDGNSGEPAVLLSMTYGSGTYESTADVMLDGNFSIEMTLPDFQPIEPTTTLSTSILNTPGNSHSVENTDASVTVDTQPPTVLFNVEQFPDSSLTVIESDSLDDVKVTVTILEAIGLNYGPLQVSWEYQRNGQPVADTQDSGELAWVSSTDDRHIFQGQLDFRPNQGFSVQEGDKMAFWVTSTDKAGNTVTGLGGPDSPRSTTVRIVEFLGEFQRSQITPTRSPILGETVTVVTYWQNPGKSEGTVSVGLYEQKEDGTWKPSISTLINGLEEIYLAPGSSSVKAEFQYQTSEEGLPLLVLVVNEDFGNENFMNVEISGIEVLPLSSENQSSGAMVWVIGGLLLLISLLGAAFYVLRGAGGEDYYYDEEYEENEEYY